MTTRQKQIPNWIDVLVSMRGDMSIDSQGAPLNGGKGDIHVKYIREDSIEDLTTLLEAQKEATDEVTEYALRHAAEVQALTAELERVREVLREVAQTLAWQSFGECRGFSDNLLSPLEAYNLAKAELNRENK